MCLNPENYINNMQNHSPSIKVSVTKGILRKRTPTQRIETAIKHRNEKFCAPQINHYQPKYGFAAELQKLSRKINRPSSPEVILNH
jgi:hypothetical protein